MKSTRKVKNGASGRKDDRPKKKPVQRSAKGGLLFSVGKIIRRLRKGRYADHIRMDAAVCLRAVLEYLTNEVLDLGGDVAKENREKEIIPRHVLLAVKNDEELNKLLSGVIIPYAEFVYEQTESPTKADNSPERHD